MGPGVAALQKRIDTLADEYIEKMVAADGEIDFAREIAMQFPLRVIMSILGLPHGDAPFVLRMTQQLLSAGDPDLARSDQGGTDVLPEVFQYFGQILADRRANPQEDLASVIANAMIGDEAIGAIEAISYYLLVSTAGHETTAASPAGGLLAIIQHPQELDSGNRDDSVFADPYRFDIERAAQAHVGFGWGGHGCLGRQVALAEIRTFFAKLLPRLESVELAGEPRPIESNFTGGYKSLPIRYRLRAAAV